MIVNNACWKSFKYNLLIFAASVATYLNSIPTYFLSFHFPIKADKELVAKILEEQYPSHLPYVFRSPSGTLLETINEQQDLMDLNYVPQQQYNNNNNATITTMGYDAFSVPSTPLPDITSPNSSQMDINNRPLYFFSSSNDVIAAAAADPTTAVS